METNSANTNSNSSHPNPSRGGRGGRGGGRTGGGRGGRHHGRGGRFGGRGEDGTVLIHAPDADGGGDGSAGSKNSRDYNLSETTSEHLHLQQHQQRRRIIGQQDRQARAGERGMTVAPAA